MTDLADLRAKAEAAIASKGALDWDEADPVLVAEFYAAANPQTILLLLARVERSENLLRLVRNADVIFAKGDWEVSRAIAEYFDDAERQAPR